jgi:hypothetical protein
VSNPVKCGHDSCPNPGIMAIRIHAPRDKSLVHTVWQDEADAPKVATRYCGPHGVALAASLAALTDSSLHPEVRFRD